MASKSSFGRDGENVRRKRKTIEDRLEASAVGVIREDELYSRERFIKRMGLTRSAWEEMCKRGLPVIGIGKRVYVCGRQAMSFLTSHRWEGYREPTCRVCGEVARSGLELCSQCELIGAVNRLAKVIER